MFAYRRPLWTILITLTAWSFALCSGSAQTEAQIRAALRNIRADDVPRNGASAAEWLFAHRNNLTRQLREELPRTDRQGRDAIFYSLISTKGFKPDAQFCRMIVSRLNDEDKKVANYDLFIGLHWKAWPFIAAHHEQFKPLLVENLAKSDDMWCIWSTIAYLSMRKELAEEIPRLPDNVWNMAATSLKDDKYWGNAAQAVRTYLIIGKDSLPHLQPLRSASDGQQQDFAKATIDAIGGSRRAYGYLASQVSLDKEFSGGYSSPNWLGAEIGKWNPDSQVRQRYR